MSPFPDMMRPISSKYPALELDSREKEKGLIAQAFLTTAKPASACAVEKCLKRTLYCQVGNRCLRPKVPSSGLFRAGKV